MPAYHYQQGDRPLEGYTIQYALGRGGFGEVYFATSDAGREVALKSVLNYEDIELRGIGHCMNLKSPHLVMIFDVKQGTDGTPWVIMEYVAGSSLRDILDGHPQGLSPAQTAFLIRELARGIDYLHSAGIVHRDLKPHNVFFEDGIVKIGDYSLSKVISVSHASGHTMTVGSVHYMAPEISLGKYDRTVDLYALGVMLYEMLTGKPPYVGESVGEVLMKHLNSEVDVTKLPQPFASVVQKAMHRDPTQRYQSAGEMADALKGEDQGVIDESIPASLSMVGQRRNEQASPRSQRSAVIRASLEAQADTVDVPLAAGDTAESQPQRPSRHIAHDHSELVAQPTALDFAVRVGLSLVSTVILMLLAMALSLEFWPGNSIAELVAIAFGLWVLALALSASTVESAKTAAAICRNHTLLSHVFSRVWMVGFWAVFFAVSLSLDAHELFVQPLSRLVGHCFVGVVVVTLALDWHSFANPRRRQRVLLPHTLAAGVVSGIVTGGVSQSMAAVVIAMSATMSIAITTALVTKWSEPQDDETVPLKSSQANRDADYEASLEQQSVVNRQSHSNLEKVAW